MFVSAAVAAAGLPHSSFMVLNANTRHFSPLVQINEKYAGKCAGGDGVAMKTLFPFFFGFLSPSSYLSTYTEGFCTRNEVYIYFFLMHTYTKEVKAEGFVQRAYICL